MTSQSYINSQSIRHAYKGYAATRAVFSSKLTQQSLKVFSKELKGVEKSVKSIQISNLKGPTWQFPENPTELLKDLPRDRKGIGSPKHVVLVA